MTLIRNTGGNLKFWGHLVGAKDAFPMLQMAQIESPELKKLAQYCAGRVPVLLYSYLYRTLSPQTSAVLSRKDESRPMLVPVVSDNPSDT